VPPLLPGRLDPGPPGRRRLPALLIAATLAVLLVACEAGPPAPTPPIVAGASDRPREVNLIAKDYSFLPDALDLVPGETVLLHVVNGGLAVHEAIIGDARVQAAWEVAEAATEGAPPGPTPLVSVPPDVAGIRIVVASGERVDLVWTVPVDVGADDAWIVGCHIPGHWERGMQIPVRWVGGDAATAPPEPAS
jgi:uncharacterized cupredoxin-like copper-binding protein